jgi:hypothetical protein
MGQGWQRVRCRVMQGNMADSGRETEYLARVDSAPGAAAVAYDVFLHACICMRARVPCWHGCGTVRFRSVTALMC